MQLTLLIPEQESFLAVTQPPEVWSLVELRFAEQGMSDVINRKSIVPQ